MYKSRQRKLPTLPKNLREIERKIRNIAKYDANYLQTVTFGDDTAVIFGDADFIDEVSLTEGGVAIAWDGTFYVVSSLNEIEGYLNE